jgi:PAS domain S-box-containing protein
MPTTRIDDAIAGAMLAWLDRQAAGGIITTDTAFTIQSCNQWLLTSAGWERDDIIGKPLFEVVPSLIERGIDTTYRDALAGQVSVLSHVLHQQIIPCRRGQGELMPQRARIYPLISGDKIVGTVTTIEDVGERLASDRQLRAQIARAEEARINAEAASRTKDEFLATLSHEIRTPLSAVLGWVHLLKAREPDAATVKRAVEVIERNAKAQLTLISDMLDMARIASGKVRLDFADVDLTAVVNAAMDAVRPTADAKGVRLVADVKAETMLVSGDADRLQQVAWNILSNAVKFTGAGGMVVVSLRADRLGTHLHVADTGQGIDPRFLPKMFERFRQADTSAARRTGGLGLGLALVKDLVTMHGGSVEVESPGLGLGATFMVHLPPRAPALAAPPRRDASEIKTATLDGVRVMVIEDDPDAREIAARSIQDAGGEVIAVANATEALTALVAGSSPPDAIISDIGLPGTDGYDLLREVRKLPRERGGSVPAIAVTAYASAADEQRALSHGFTAHITKPFEPSHLIAAVHNALRT